MAPSEVSSKDLSGVGRRALAIFIDAIFLYVITLIVANLTHANQGYTFTGFIFPGWGFAVWGACIFLYFTLLEWLWGRTIGKAATGIHVLRADGSRPGLVASAIRTIFRLIDTIPYIPFPYLLGAAFCWNTTKRQRLGDIVAQTVVVNNIRPVSSVPVPDEKVETVNA